VFVILGIDPGTQLTGYGVIRTDGASHQAIDYGCIRPPSNLKITDRYLIIFNSVDALLEKHCPHALVVETQYVQKNIQSAIKLGMARGVVIVAAKRRGIAVFEYAPAKAKRAVVGNGNASKYQVQGMVKILLNLTEMPTPDDAADALSLAICHAQTLRLQMSHSLEI
jgi:crossover junction endodeoxyribonuclease RuvC